MRRGEGGGDSLMSFVCLVTYVPSLFRPKFSVVVVTKRIITRIFLNQRGQISNPPPGTVVDTEITKPQW